MLPPQPRPPKRKIGRNERCWCGSGKKYKKCHYERDKAPPKTISDFYTTMKQVVTSGRCLYEEPDGTRCDSTPISAHSISKGASLSRISESHHVIGFVQKHKGDDLRIVPEKKSIKKASTFRGFCSKHDSELFNSIDKNSFSVDADYLNQLYLRSISMELHKKERNLSLEGALRAADSGRPLADQIASQEMASQFLLATDVAQKELHVLFNRQMERCRKGKAHADPILTAAFKFDASIPFQAVGNCSPTFSPLGKKLQNPEDLGKPLMTLSISVINDRDSSYIVIQSENSSKVIFNAFLERLRKAQSPDYAFSFCLLNIENLFLKISWWESLSDKDQDLIIEAIENYQELEPHNYEKYLFNFDAGISELIELY